MTHLRSLAAWRPSRIELDQRSRSRLSAHTAVEISRDGARDHALAARTRGDARRRFAPLVVSAAAALDTALKRPCPRSFTAQRSLRAKVDQPSRSRLAIAAHTAVELSRDGAR